MQNPQIPQFPEDETSAAPYAAVSHSGKNSFWRKLGGGSLSISIIVHAILLAIGVVWIFQVIPHQEPPVDFMPKGGGGGTPGQKSETANKKRATMTSMNAPRVAAKGATSSFSLPEPDAASAISAVGSLGGSLSGGLGGSGSGGGRGSGNGTGFGSGSGPGLGGGAAGIKPFAGMMFGTEIKAKTIGMVLDVSGSMLGHLPKVVAELDRVAEGSPLVLYVGCGIEEGRPDDKAISTTGIDPQRFERFWRITHEKGYGNPTVDAGRDKVKVDFTTPIPSEKVFKILANRPNTYFIDYQGSRFAYAALLCKQMKDCEAVYWFADFQDRVTEDGAQDVLRKLRGRKQKLYMHPSSKGNAFEAVRDMIAQPSGGTVVEPK